MTGEEEETFDFIKEYSDWIKDKFSQKSIGEFTEITTPFVDSHNDQIRFYISRTENGYKLTDDGYIINDLIMCGCDVLSKKRKEMLHHLADSMGVEIEGLCITVEATQKDIAHKQHTIIQAMLKIGDMFLTTSSV